MNGQLHWVLGSSSAVVRVMPWRHGIAGVTALLCFLLCGCMQSWVWDKPGVNAATLDQDSKQCLYEARIHANTGSSSAGVAEMMQEAELGTLCMEAKGYRKKSAS